MAENESPSDERVGYGRPPKSTQFAKGQSGNPKGRPKGSKNLPNLLAKALTEKVIINKNGRKKTVTKGEAAIKQLVDKATAGDLSALRLLIALTTTIENAVPPETKQSTASESDQKIIQRLFERLEQSRRTTDGNDN